MLRLKLHTHSSVGLQVSEVFSKQLRLLLVHCVICQIILTLTTFLTLALQLALEVQVCYCLIISVHVFSTVLTLLLRGVVIPENKVLDKEDLGITEAGALSVVTPYSGDLRFHYPEDDTLVQPDNSLNYFWISSNQTFSNNGSHIARLRRRRDEEQSNSQEGVWRCSVPSDANGGRRSIYFGLYSRGML